MNLASLLMYFNESASSLFFYVFLCSLNCASFSEIFFYIYCELCAFVLGFCEYCVSRDAHPPLPTMNFSRLLNGPNEVRPSEFIRLCVFCLVVVSLFKESNPTVMNSPSLLNMLNEAYTTFTVTPMYGLVDTVFVIFVSTFLSSFFLGWIFWIVRSSAPDSVKQFLALSFLGSVISCVFCAVPVRLLLLSYCAVSMSCFLVVMFFLKGEKYGVLAVFTLLLFRLLDFELGWAFLTSYSVVLSFASDITRQPPAPAGGLVEADLAPLLQLQGQLGFVALGDDVLFFDDVPDPIWPGEPDFDAENDANLAELEQMMLEQMMFDLGFPLDRSVAR